MKLKTWEIDFDMLATVGGVSESPEAHHLGVANNHMQAAAKKFETHYGKVPHRKAKAKKKKSLSISESAPRWKTVNYSHPFVRIVIMERRAGMP